MTLALIALIGFCIVVEAILQLCFKQAANQSSLLQIVAKPILWLGIFLWIVELIAWTNVLEHVALSIAFPIMSFTYVTTLVAGAIVFKEKVNKRHAIGAILITIGVALIGATGV